ncbi:MAG TPA: heavy metal-responsive transcriptional regulator [Acidimicrobiales bacterium]|nr:heavy metal-responsive transcriptional regulator [Acidimicrobiales bacterium]
MRIGELAERLGINTKTIRYYESIGLLPEPDRTESGYRDYGEADVERLVFIKSAQRLGLALDEVGEILALRERGQVPCDYVRGLISEEIADIDRRLQELRQLRQELVAMEERTPPAPDNGGGSFCGLIDHVRQRGQPAASSPRTTARKRPSRVVTRFSTRG